MFVGLFRRDPIAIAFVRNLLLAFFPAVILGLALGDQIELLLENAVVVAWALGIGGFVLLFVARFAQPEGSGRVAALSVRPSTTLGLSDCLVVGRWDRRLGAISTGEM